MNISKGVAGAMDAASRGAGALPHGDVPDVVSDAPNSLVVQPKSPSIGSVQRGGPAPGAQDVDLSLYEPIAGPRAHQAAKILMVLFGALAALLIVGFGVWMFSAGLSQTLSEFFK